MFDLSKPGPLYQAMIELTTSCNLRCSYCAVSSPHWQPKTLDESKISLLIDSLKDLQTKRVIIHGHGETTAIDHWEDIAQRFYDAGFELIICTNLAKQYTNKELGMLARFKQITVSIDTIDPIIFKQLRRGGDLKQVVFNITRIRSFGVPIHWVWSSVVCDRTISGLLDLVHYGRSLGVSTFCLCNLTIETDVQLRHISQLSPPELREAAMILARFQIYCDKYGLVADIKSGLLDTLYGQILHSSPSGLYTLMP